MAFCDQIVVIPIRLGHKWQLVFFIMNGVGMRSFIFTFSIRFCVLYSLFSSFSSSFPPFRIISSAFLSLPLLPLLFLLFLHSLLFLLPLPFLRLPLPSAFSLLPPPPLFAAVLPLRPLPPRYQPLRRLLGSVPATLLRPHTSAMGATLHWRRCACDALKAQNLEKLLECEFLVVGLCHTHVSDPAARTGADPRLQQRRRRLPPAGRARASAQRRRGRHRGRTR